MVAGTRGSLLAVSQSKLVLSQISEANPGLSFEIRIIKTSGDEGLEVLGAFVKEVENELRSSHIDLAIHSLKDMPTQLPTGVTIACMPGRGEYRDCLISRDNMQLHELPAGARIGTGSLRRAYQLKKMREDIEVVPIRGNIITRMNKIEEGIVDAVVLAAAGLQRVDMAHRISQLFSIEEMLPAVAQGILAVEVREDDPTAIALVDKVNDKDTALCAVAERNFLSALGGGCRMPIAAYAEIKEGKLLLRGMLCNEAGTQMEKDEIVGNKDQAADIGASLAGELLKRFPNKPF